MRLIIICMLLFGIVSHAFGQSSVPIMVFAGSASQPPLEEAAELFTEQTGTPVILHFGGSGAMLSQILLTGQGDLYIPGSPDYLQKAVELQLVDGRAQILAYLVPALIVPKGNPLNISSLEDLTGKSLRVGMADPDSVCVGLYAVEILEANNLLEQIRPNLYGMVESCAKAASMVPLGAVDVVLGWREFAQWNRARMDAVPLRPEEIPRLAYIPAVRTRNSGNPGGTDAFVAFLKTAQGQAIFHKWGYFTEEGQARRLAPNARIGGTYRLPEGW